MMQRAIDLMTGMVVIAMAALAGDLLAHLAARFVSMPLPGPILGMVLIAAMCGLFPSIAARLHRAAALLTGLLGAFIVPPLVGLALFAAEIAAHGPALAFILIVSTVLTGLVTVAIWRIIGPRAA